MSTASFAYRSIKHSHHSRDQNVPNGVVGDYSHEVRGTAFAIFVLSGWPNRKLHRITPEKSAWQR
jgi:hypothetical protein